MPEILNLEFDGVTADDYNAVNELLGIDTITGKGDWPEGLVTHLGAAESDGTLTVIEVWESKEAQEAFMSSRLGEALGKANVGEPKAVRWLKKLAHHNPTRGK
jgi:hypothetical protein